MKSENNDTISPAGEFMCILSGYDIFYNGEKIAKYEAMYIVGVNPAAARQIIWGHDLRFQAIKKKLDPKKGWIYI